LNLAPQRTRGACRAGESGQDSLIDRWPTATSESLNRQLAPVERLHHSAEIGVLRDLHRGHGRSDWWPEPLGS
jgi:hypothetical protein